MPVALVTDSTASLSAETARAAKIDIVALQVVIGADVYTEGEDVTPQMVSEALAAYVPVNTSRPTPTQFTAAYERAAAAGATEIVSVHLSSKMSGTFDSALLAAKTAPVPVTCVDSTQVGVATGFATLRAVTIRDQGGDAQACAEAARQAGKHSFTLFYVDTLEYLRRGGRVGAAAALFGSALAIKPLLTMNEGLISPLEKVRTAAKALGRMEALSVERSAAFERGFDVGVQHLANPTVALAVARRLAVSLGKDSIEVREVGASIGAHVGPGMIGVSLTPR
ncbi:MAG: DegV family protein [Kineosporiaceae bacterium]|nr:DegV family protein [Aeromicrobium sp.]